MVPRGPRASTWVPRGPGAWARAWGRGSCREGPTGLAQLRVPGHLRSPGRGGRSGSKPSQAGSTALPLGPKHPPAPAAPWNTHQLHGTLKAPIKQHRSVGLSTGSHSSNSPGLCVPRAEQAVRQAAGFILPNMPLFHSYPISSKGQQ